MHRFATRLAKRAKEFQIELMAIQFARARYISRASGGSAVRSAAYNERAAIVSDRTGEVFYFKHRDAPEHHEVLLPDGAGEKFADSAILWNAAEAAERRKDAQVAREIVLALPANAELTDEDRIDLARSFAEQHFVSKGLAVQLDVHRPHEGDSESERANWHAHLLITTRRLEGERFAAKKARDLDPEVRRAGGRAVVADGEAWGELWRDHQNRYFVEHGIDARVDPTATHAQQHIGPVRMRKADSAAGERAETLRQANQAAARDPDQVLATLTRNNATFSERDLDRHLAKHIAPDAERAATKAAVLGHAETLPLYDRDSGEAAERYTTKTVRAQERAALADAADVAGARHQRGLPTAAISTAVAARSMRPDQRLAFDHAVAAGGLKIIEGRAGTGKSYVLQAIRDAHEQAGRRVIGLAPTNAVAQDLKADGFSEAGTAHAELFRLKNGRTHWDRRTVVIVDEAAMLDSRVTGEVLGEARRSGAKVILAGDDRQLASIERGGLFTEMRQRHGAAEITEITRQRSDWQRAAARDLAEGRFGDAVAAFDAAGAITWTRDHEDARTALVAAWKRDTAAEPDATRFVFAYTNVDVDALNAELRQVRRERGELAGEDTRFETKHGEAAFAPGDRVQFTDTLKFARIYNGNVGTISEIDAETGVIRARLDAAAGQEGREVEWSASEFIGFRHGYAGTIYKGQGKTLDHTYLYHTHHWRSAASYVALTRQRESAQVFVATATARNAEHLARQMARGEVKAASVAWATLEELAPAQRERVREAERAARDEQEQRREHQRERAGPETEGEVPRATGVADTGHEVVERESAGENNRPGEGARPSAAPEPPPAWSDRAGEGASAAPEMLIPPHADPEGRDSLGRGLDDASIAIAAGEDRAVQREKEALWLALRTAYRDPYAAKAELDEMVKRQGWTSTAARLRPDPSQLGALHGRSGLFAGRWAKLERATAMGSANGVAFHLDNIGEAEAKAAAAYRASVEAQRAADATPIPRLSAWAEAAVTALGTVSDESARADLWRGLMTDKTLGPELARFSAAVRQRFGEDTVRGVLRSGGSLEAASLPRAGQAALATVSRTVQTLEHGERAVRQEDAQRLNQRQTLGARAGMRP
jgi:Ti-type conjugative transfer relaxase TraA